MLKNFKSYQTSLVFYKECKKLKLPSYLRSQLLRASSSICLNLSEGSARQTRKDRVRFYNIALASTREVQAIFDLELSTKTDLYDLADQLGAMIYKLSQNA